MTKKATSNEIKALIVSLKSAVNSVYNERHNNLPEARANIREAALRIHQLQGILEVRQMRGEA